MLLGRADSADRSIMATNTNSESRSTLQEQLRVKGELIRQLKKDEAPAERVSMTVGVAIMYPRVATWAEWMTGRLVLLQAAL